MTNRTILRGALVGLWWAMSFGGSWAEEATSDVPVAISEQEQNGQSSAEASATIEAFNSALVEAIQSDSAVGFGGRLEIIMPAVWEAFDMELLSRRTIGRLKWRRWSEDEQKTYIEILHVLQSATLADRFTHGSEVSFVIDDVSDGPKDSKLVHTRIVRDTDEDVKLNYLLLERDEKWRVVDVYLNSTISEVATRRADYSKILNDEGFEALIAALNKQIDDIYERNGETRSAAQTTASN